MKSVRVKKNSSQSKFVDPLPFCPNLMMAIDFDNATSLNDPFPPSVLGPMNNSNNNIIKRDDAT